MPTNTKYILVAGGAGYIGAHMVLALRAAGYQVLVLDNLSTGHAQALLDCEFIKGDVQDPVLLHSIFSSYSIVAVMHFAASIEVAASWQDPEKFYQNNVTGTLNLLACMRAQQIKHLIFSSTAAVYGNPSTQLITESQPLLPINPYGRSKKMMEDIIQDYGAAYGLRYALLRYFNAAGADPHGRVGEAHPHESHLIPLALTAALSEKNIFTIYGNDYPTADGTCVRDYVHVYDLCQAHLLALEKLFVSDTPIICNLGTGVGHSVLEVIHAVKAVSNKELNIQYGARRLGDPAYLVADATLAKATLGWQPKYPHLNQMVQHAWNFVLATQFVESH